MSINSKAFLWGFHFKTTVHTYSFVLYTSAFLGNSSFSTYLLHTLSISPAVVSKDSTILSTFLMFV